MVFGMEEFLLGTDGDKREVQDHHKFQKITTQAKGYNINTEFLS